jgi:hypothetical protein
MPQPVIDVNRLPIEGQGLAQRLPRGALVDDEPAVAGAPYARGPRIAEAARTARERGMCPLRPVFRRGRGPHRRLTTAG